jgi:hypothetical protein
MPDLRQTLAMLAPRVTAAWGPAAAYDLEMRVVPLGQLGEVIDRIGAVALDVELASFLAGPRPKAVAIALLARLRRRPRVQVPQQEPGLEWEPPPVAAPAPADPIEAWSADEAAGSSRADARTAPIDVDPDEVVLAAEVDRTAFIATSRPVPELTRYHEALLRLLGPCQGGPAVQ